MKNKKKLDALYDVILSLNASGDMDLSTAYILVKLINGLFKTNYKI